MTRGGQEGSEENYFCIIIDKNESEEYLLIRFLHTYFHNKSRL